jgi:hypothetical protein
MSSKKILTTIFLEIEEKDVLCILIYTLILTGLIRINHMDE